MIFGRPVLGEPSPPGAGSGAAVDPHEAEIALRAGDRVDHGEGALMDARRAP